jgi:hypothetical protein
VIELAYCPFGHFFHRLFFTRIKLIFPSALLRASACSARPGLTGSASFCPVAWVRSAPSNRARWL